jgi:uncharacterized protein
MSDETGDACPWNPDRSQDERKRELLGTPRVVAVVGMSSNRERPSNYVARYLMDHGFTVLAVNPTLSEVEGLKAYPDLRSIPKETKVELVDLFVAPQRTMPVVEQAAEIGAPVVWFQPGAEHAPAEERARALGLEVFSGTCTKAEHERLLGG